MPPYASTYTVDFLRGSKSEKIWERHKTLSTYGAGIEFSKEDWFGFFKNLIGLGFLKQVGNEYPVLNLTEKSAAVLRGEEKVFLTKTVSRKTAIDSEKPHELGLLDELKKLRYKLAQKENVPAYIIFSDATLLELATYLPQSLEEMKAYADRLAKKGIRSSIVGELTDVKKGMVLVEKGKETKLVHPIVDPFWRAFYDAAQKYKE